MWDDQTGNASYREPDAHAYYTENQLKLLFTIIPCTKTLLKPIVHLPQRHMRTSVDEARQEMCVWKHPVGRVRDLSSRLVILDIRLFTFLLSAPSTVSPDTGRIVRHFVLCFFSIAGSLQFVVTCRKKREERKKIFKGTFANPSSGLPVVGGIVFETILARNVISPVVLASRDNEGKLCVYFFYCSVFHYYPSQLFIKYRS